MLTVGIIGCGFVGGALKDWLEKNNKDVKVVVSDPPKGMNDDISGADVYFIQIHVPTEDDGTQDLTLMKKLIMALPDKPVFVRTTILPGTSARLTKETGHRVYFMPEFLTERTYIEDFKKQPMVFTGEIELLCSIFKGKTFTTMTPLEAEITKYAHNVFTSTRCTTTASAMARTGPESTQAFCSLATSTTLILLFPDPTASSATAASASPRMSTPSRR
jgi:UDPglucose 6-dehydrogenase